MTAESLRAQYALFRRLRWLGVVLFLCAIPVPVGVILAAALHEGRWAWLIPTIGCFGLSLGTFGTANDTAIFALRELAKREPLAPAAEAELRQEVAKRPERLLEVHSSPKAAFIFPLLAIALIGWMAMRIAGAWTA